MGSKHLQQLTVVAVSPSGREPTEGTLDGGDHGLAFDVVTSPDQALDRVAEGGVDAVVCEHGPPEVDAVAFVRELRRRDGSLPVVVLPADDASDCTADALEAGATDVAASTAGSTSATVLANRLHAFAGRHGTSSPAEDPAASPPADDCTAPTTGAGDEPADSADYLAAVSDAVERLRSVDDPGDVADVVASAVEDGLDVPGVAVFLFDDERNDLRPAAITDQMAGYYGGRTVFGPRKPDSVTWRAFVSGETLAYDDLRTTSQRVCDETAARACIFAPLGQHGTLAVASDTVGAFGQSGRTVVDLLAGAAASALDRIESDAALRRRDRQICDRDDRIDYLEGVAELVGDLQRAVVGNATRGAIERAVVERLVADDLVDFAWVGGIDASSGTVTPREWAGAGSQYLDEVSLDVDTSDEPACRTARDWTPTAVPNVADDLEDGNWERTALSRDFHSVLSVPLAYEGVMYGVLTAYTNRPNGFWDPVSALFEQFGETAAWSMNAAERAYAMLSNQVTELELEIGDPDDVLNVIAETIGSTVECLEIRPQSDGRTRLQFAATGVSAESVLASTAGLVAVDSVTHVGGDDAHLFTAVVDEGTVGSVLVTSGGIPAEITADGRTLTVAVNVPGSLDARAFVERLERRYPSTTLLARRVRDRSTLSRLGFMDELESVLTDRQLEVLQTAYEAGFFESPRRSTGQDVAALLDVSQPTVSHHLRQGQGKLFSLLFGDG